MTKNDAINSETRLMDMEYIKTLVEKGESHNVEFKKSTAMLKGAFQSICAFLNSQGGTVLIGVMNEGQIVGQEVNDQTKQHIANEVDEVEPPDNVEIHYVPLHKKNLHVIVLSVKAGAHKPYVYDGRPYQREQTVTKRMPQQFYDRLVAQRLQLNFSWESAIAPEYSISDLDEELLRGVVRRAVEKQRMPEEAVGQDVPKLLQALKLLVENEFVNNAAVVLFGKKITSTFYRCQLKMARFKGIDRREFMDSSLVYGNVFELLNHGMMFVRRHLPLAGKIIPGQLEREETPLIPYDAVRETLINAMCHKDYSAPGGSIGIAIYDDRMEIFNNGGLMANLSLERIKTGYSDPRNPTIAAVLYRANLIEAWGRGIPEIIRQCIEADDIEPEFDVDAVEFKVVFKFPFSIKPPVYQMDKVKEFDNLSPRQEEIVELLSDGNQRRARDILKNIQEKVTIRTLQRDLTKLQELGILKLEGYFWTLKNKDTRE